MDLLLLLIDILSAIIKFLRFVYKSLYSDPEEAIRGTIKTLVIIALIITTYISCKYVVVDNTMDAMNKMMETVQQIQSQENCERSKGQLYQLNGIKAGIESIHEPINVLEIESTKKSERYITEHSTITVTDGNASVEYENGMTIMLTDASVDPY